MGRSREEDSGECMGMRRPRSAMTETVGVCTSGNRRREILLSDEDKERSKTKEDPEEWF